MTATPALPRAEIAKHRPLDLRSVQLSDRGRLGAWQQQNGQVTIPHCIEALETSGVLDNFRRVIGESGADYRGFVFADSDLYKVIEAVAWEIGRTGTTAFDPWLDDVIALVARVQEPSGYVMTWIQGVHPEKKFAELHWTHEMYVAGHLVQAAIALDRAAGRDDLLRVARRFADLLDRRFGPRGEPGICGHPEIETALVELYRQTRERRYLDLAQRMVDLRGQGLLAAGGHGARYFQDHAPVREAGSAVGHAVRQLYLNAGVSDLHLETGEPALAEAMLAQWDSAHLRKMYLTGAFGARHAGEAFGDDYELPPDRAYAETCATIADIHWNWRMLLTHGDSRYAETMERELHNALAAAVDSTGTRFFYANPLQLRKDRASEQNAPRDRQSWYACACCPPNIARLIAQLGAYLATSTDKELAVHLYADAEIDLPNHLGSGTLRISTSYPDDSTITLALDGTARAGARLALRVPSWSPQVTVNGTPMTADEDGYLRLDLDGSTIVLGLDLSPRWTYPHPQIDAVRGTVALERGPLVYCLEQVDLPDGVALGDIVVSPEQPLLVGDGVLQLAGSVRRTAADGLYRTVPAGPGPGPSMDGGEAAAEVPVVAVPFATWGNRGSDAMRVWIPTGPPAARQPATHDPSGSS